MKDSLQKKLDEYLGVKHMVQVPSRVLCKRLKLNKFQAFSSLKEGLESLVESVSPHFVSKKKMQNTYDFKRARLVQSNHKKGWYVQFYVWHVQKNRLVRKRKYVPDSVYTTRESKIAYAKNIVKEINKLLRKGYHIDLSENNTVEKSEEVTHFLTIKEAISRYFNYCDKVAKNCQQELSNKFYLIKKFFDWCEKHNYEFIMLSDITEQAALRFFDDMIEVDGVSGKTYNNSLGRLRNFYNVALRRKWVDGTSPFKLVEKQRIGYGEKNRAFSEYQLNEMIPYLKDNEEYLYKFIGFIYYALMRPSEIKRLKVRNIDMQKRQIRIEAEQSKVKKMDVLPIADGLYEILRTMDLENQDPDYFLFSSKKKPSNFPMSRGWTTERFKKVKDKFNLDANYSIYGFKHTAVCKWYEQTKDIVRVQRMCRHTSIDMTARYLKSLGVMGDQYKIDSLPNLI